MSGDGGAPLTRAQLRAQREAADREAAERAGAEREAAERAAAERLAVEREAAEREAVRREAAERQAAEQEAAEREATERDAAQREAAHTAASAPASGPVQKPRPVPAPDAGAPAPVRRGPIRPEIMGRPAQRDEPEWPEFDLPAPSSDRSPARTFGLPARRGSALRPGTAGREPIRPEIMGPEPEASETEVSENEVIASETAEHDSVPPEAAELEVAEEAEAPEDAASAAESAAKPRWWRGSKSQAAAEAESGAAVTESFASDAVEAPLEAASTAEPARGARWWRSSRLQAPTEAASDPAPGPRRSPNPAPDPQAEARSDASPPGPRRSPTPDPAPLRSPSPAADSTSAARSEASVSGRRRSSTPDSVPGPRRSQNPDPSADDTVPPVPTPTTPVSRLEPIPWEPAAPPASDGSAYRRRRRLIIVLAAIVAVLVIAGAVFAFVFSQSLRVMGVDVDPARAIEASGTTLTFDTNHDLAAVEASQVAVEPAVPFTVHVDGSSLGIRFTDALDDKTEYSVTVQDAAAKGGSPTADLSTTFTTPESQIFLLQRSDKNDKIFRSDLSGENGVPVFTSSKIVDFRATPDALAVVVEDDDGSRLIVMDRKGEKQRDLKLPGDGFITSLQVSDRGGLVGYTYSDADVTETSGRASVLVTQPLDGSSGPSVVQVDGEDAGVSDWEFVPDSSKVLFVDFSNALTLDDRRGDAGSKDFGLVAELLGTTRDTAIIERTEGTFVELSLEDGTEAPLPATDPDYGLPSEIVPFNGGTLQHIVQRNDSGAPTGQAVIRVDREGAATPVLEVGDDSAIMQMCASPSGQYAAVTVAPDIADNPYDDLLLPLPTTLHTTLLDLRTGDQLVTLSGFDVSWCGSAPQP
ncbi:Ig-like domain-containing protein [Microbacterium sp. KUDC0406]|uniref:Ig-like domain-containing protein n=1 Tax=Microbacterium sp. KUDC0406 TaxID=2909588 RepID=UPI001F2AABD0|nr:Ig-like domain-containing protein [Microbacterium sp. KUDC0406]UJP09673.1 Ig-like domain-containing protein [Microbacterium sp. KUDC0406]